MFGGRTKDTPRIFTLSKLYKRQDLSLETLLSGIRETSLTGLEYLDGPIILFRWGLQWNLYSIFGDPRTKEFALSFQSIQVDILVIS